jgi:cytochrome P450
MISFTRSGTVNGVAAQPYNDRMRKFGRILHKALNRDVVLKDYASTISEEVQKLLQRLLESPDNFDVLVGRTTASVIMKVVYGYEVQGDDDKFVNLAKDHMRALMPVIRPGAWLVDSLPIRMCPPSILWLPLRHLRTRSAIRAGLVPWYTIQESGGEVEKGAVEHGANAV